MASIQIIIGSVYGRSEQVAEFTAEELRKLGHDVSLNSYVRPEDLVRNSEEVLLLCHSNTGVGELPDNIQPIYLHLTRDYPRIAGKRYGVINLADSSYSSFNEAGQMLDAAFSDLGAQRIGEPLVIDACSSESPEDLVRAWMSDWEKQL